MVFMNKKLLLTGLLVVSMTAMAATIYKWVDEKGQIQFGDKPPTEGKVESLATKEHRARSLEGQIVDGEYRTWDGTIQIRIPQLVQPGEKIKVRQINSMKSGLFMSDDFGSIYIVLITANAKPELAIEDIIQNFQPLYELLNRKVLTTNRGKELRITSLRKGGSPLTSQSIKGGKRMGKKSLNLIDATTIFLAGKHKDIIEVTAGVTDLPLPTDMSPEEEQEHLANLAEELLEEFLTGVVVK